ncbi:MAG TPA: hypothetical protein VG937_01205 [Polyangiaceae bacterium]|nr:hypothetical protein [Polyangiaceae bacterium]
MTIGRIDSSSTASDLLALDQNLCAELTGDTGAQIAAMLVLSARDSRNLSRAAEEAEEQRLTALEDQQVEELREQAADVRSAAQTRALGLLTSAATDIGCLAIGTSTPTAQLESSALKIGDKVVQSGLGFIASEQDFEASIHAADATQAANRAKHVERELQDLNEVQRDASQLARSAIESAAELVRTQNATNQATIFLRG